MLQREKLVVGNWKMHGNLADNAALLQAITEASAQMSVGLAVCAPFPYLVQVQTLLKSSGVRWGAQDVSAEVRGAYTGQVAVSMLSEFGCRYVIVGHSERRAQCGETSELVAAKAARVLEGGLIPIVCVGETLAEREAGITDEVVGAQLGAVLAAVAPARLGEMVLAYEPVWAIGTGRTATPDEAQQVHAKLRAKVVEVDRSAGQRLSILYGGSVKPGNAAELFSMPDIDGGLIGGASLVARDFVGIASALSASRAG